MATCTSWRPKPHDKHAVPERPGKCSACWTVCRNKVPSGVKRCDECIDLLLAHPATEVRRALISEPDVDETTLIRLSGDDNFGVALAAETRLEQLDETATTTPATGGFDPWAQR